MYFAVFGDSIAWGEGDEIGGGWVGNLDKHIQRKNIGRAYNLSIDGDTSKGLLQRIESEIPPRGIQKAIIAIGINDSLYRGSLEKVETPLDIFENNIKQITKKLEKFRLEFVFVGLTKVDERFTKPLKYSETGIESYDNNLIKKYNQKLKDVCRSLSIPYIELLDVLNYKDLDDGVHPNTKGHQKLFKKIKAGLLKINFFEQ